VKDGTMDRHTDDTRNYLRYPGFAAANNQGLRLQSFRVLQTLFHIEDGPVESGTLKSDLLCGGRRIAENVRMRSSRP
jgi:hypothetical protein